MKIQNSTQPITGVSVNDKQKHVDKTADSGKNSSPEQSVHLSSSALRSSSSGAIVDIARAQEIKQAISEGNFKVNPEVVADRLLETVKELIQSKTGSTT